MLPANAISTHTVFCLKSDLDEESQWCLLGLLNSLVANYLVRCKSRRMSPHPHVAPAGAAYRPSRVQCFARSRDRSPQPGLPTTAMNTPN
jgi:hypothetical protein